MMNFGWFGKLVVAMFFMVPFSILINLFGVKFGTDPIAMIFYWFASTALGVAIYMLCIGNVTVLMPNMPLIILGVVGVSLGAFANILIFQAFTDKDLPNAGLPVAIIGCNSVVIYFITPLLVRFLPAYFGHLKIDFWGGIGIVMVIAGLWLVVWQR